MEQGQVRVNKVARVWASGMVVGCSQREGLAELEERRVEVHRMEAQREVE